MSNATGASCSIGEEMSSDPVKPAGIPSPPSLVGYLLEKVRRVLFGARRGPIRNLGSLKGAVRADAAFLAQGASYAYLRARSGTHAERLFRDPKFASALNICKWETFAAASADLLVLVEAELRPFHRLPPEAVARVFSQLYDETLDLEPVPNHRGPQGWDAEIRTFTVRIQEATRHPRPPLRTVVRGTGRQILRHAPITEEVRRADAEMVSNNVEFRFAERLSALRRLLDGERVGRHLETRANEAVQT